MAAGARIGIDVGGTKIAGIVLAPDGAALGGHEVASPRNDYPAAVEAIASMAERLRGEGFADATVGIGTPGSVSPVTGRVQNGNSTWLNGQPLAEDLEVRLGFAVRLANDADCFALSEARDGAGAGARCVFGVIIGTGCGGGLVVDGRLVTGPNHTGGEWGHTPLPWPEASELGVTTCWCGRPSCMETWVAGPALEADHERVAGERIASREIVARAAAGDGEARASLDRHAGRLARGLAVIVNIIDPDVIALGGGLSEMEHLYGELPALMAPYIFADAPRVTIRPPVHGPASGVRGAARLWD